MDFIQLLSGTQHFVLSWDSALIGFVFLIGFFYGLRLGKKRLILFILSMYGSLAVLFFFPFFEDIAESAPAFSAEYISMGIFAVFLFVFYFVFSGSAIPIMMPLPRRRKKGQFFAIFLLSIVASGLLVSVLLSLLATLVTQNISGFTQNIFLSQLARFVWLLAPLAVIFLVARPKKRKI